MVRVQGGATAVLTSEIIVVSTDPQETTLNKRWLIRTATPASVCSELLGGGQRAPEVSVPRRVGAGDPG